MAVLVTGGAGYIGSHMVWELLDSGEEDVVVIDRLSTGFDWAVAPEAKFVVGDVADKELVGALIREHGIDAIIHFAGSIVVPESVADPLAYYENNTSKTRTLIETAVRAGVSNFIFSSTAAVYGSAGLEPVVEDASTAPESPYGRSKLMSEWMLRDAAAAHGLRYTALRYFNVAGADPKGRTGQSTPRRRWANAPPCRCSEPTIRHPTAPVCATISMSAIWPPRTGWRCKGCAPAAAIWSPIVVTATAIPCSR